jgi:hypothetical protein
MGLTRDDIFKPENALQGKKEYLSPSGNYKIVTTKYKTLPGSWDYLLIELFSTKTGEKITEIRRNYSSIFYLWAENHRITGDDYLITGENYQGYTVVNLTKKKVTTPKNKTWCPSSAKVMPGGTSIMVEGCYWASSYDIQIWDFSNPDSPELEESGLPELTRNISIYYDEDTDVTSDEEEGLLAVMRYEKMFSRTGQWEHEIDDIASDILAQRTIAEDSGDKQKSEEYMKKYSDHFNHYYSDDDNDDGWKKIPHYKEVFKLDKNGLYAKEPSLCWSSERKIEQDRKNKEYADKIKQEFEIFKNTDLIYSLLTKKWPSVVTSDRIYRFFPSRNQVSLGKERGEFTCECHIKDYVSTGKPAITISWGRTEGDINLKFSPKGSFKPTTFPRTLDGWNSLIEVINKELSL